MKFIQKKVGVMGHRLRNVDIHVQIQVRTGICYQDLFCKEVLFIYLAAHQISIMQCIHETTQGQFSTLDKLLFGINNQ